MCTNFIFPLPHFIYFLTYSRPEPATEPLHLGLVKIFLAISLGVYIGAKLSMKMVKFLEEYEIFVPDEDDDD